MSKVVLAVTVNEITNDNRVINYTNALAENGYTTFLFSPQTTKEHKVAYFFNPVYIKLLSDRLPSFFIFNYIRLFEFVFKAYKRSKSYQPDIIHANDLKGLLIASKIKKHIKKDVQIVYDAHEYETEVNGLKGVQKKIYKRLERGLMKNVTRMITVSDTIAQEYVKLYGIEKPEVLLNVPKFTFQDGQQHDLFRQKFKINSDQRIFLYQGYLMPGRGIEILLESFNGLEDDKNVIVFMGKGSLSDLIKSYQKTGRVFFHDFVDPNEYLNYTSSADVGISFIEDISLSDRYCLPNKLFEYMFCGLPIVCSNLPEMKRLVELNNVGVVAKENTDDGFMNAIKDLNKKGLSFFKKNTPKASLKYSWSNQEEKLLNLYEQL